MTDDFEQYAPFAPSLAGTASFLGSSKLPSSSSESDAAFVSSLQAESKHITAMLERERTRATMLKTQLEELWQSDISAAYELTSVFIHRGSSPSWGHYFFYSRHLPDNPDSWFKYNDSDVSVVSKDEVLRDTTGDTANPYMVCCLFLLQCPISDLFRPVACVYAKGHEHYPDRP